MGAASRSLFAAPAASSERVAAMEPVNRGHFFRLKGKRGREFLELILAWPPQAGLNFGALDSF